MVKSDLLLTLCALQIIVHGLGVSLSLIKFGLLSNASYSLGNVDRTFTRKASVRVSASTVEGVSTGHAHSFMLTWLLLAWIEPW